MPAARNFLSFMAGERSFMANHRSSEVVRSHAGRSVQTTIWLFGCICCCALLLGPTQSAGQAVAPNREVAPDGDIDQRHIGELIQQLGDENFHRRSTARWELERIGLEAFEQLQAAANDLANPEISRAARYLVSSQKITWWLETDSLDVRSLLENYNALDRVGRKTCYDQLSLLASGDALLALARLARYESDEHLSKAAALALMERIELLLEAQEEDLKAHSQAVLSPPLMVSLRETIGSSGRRAAQWLTAVITDLAAISNAGGNAARVEVWRELVQAEHAAAANSNQLESTRLAVGLYRWLGEWITRLDNRESAIRLVRPSLELIEKNVKRVRDAAEWTLSAELPELLADLAEKQPDLFEADSTLGYLLAESYLKRGDHDTAERIADKTSTQIAESVRTQLERFNPQRDAFPVEAQMRYDLAQRLAWRGAFAWSEREYLKILELHQSHRERAEPETYRDFEIRVRERLSYLYWTGNQNAQAAQALAPLVESLESKTSEPAHLQFNDPMVPVSNYYFYLGLAAIDDGEFGLAAEHLQKAYSIKLVDPNPDIVIAMHAIATTEPFASYYRQTIDELVKQFRVEVVERENRLARGEDRNGRKTLESELATACNQLAWLLSRCEESTEEALKLSLRSLELLPDEPAYLDTLARCFFANGRVEEAVKTQKRAVSLAAHERQMEAQLAEFEAALAKKQAANKP